LTLLKLLCATHQHEKGGAGRSLLSQPVLVILTPYIVTLSLFQGPFLITCLGLAEQWMLKQVQYDEKESGVAPET